MKRVIAAGILSSTLAAGAEANLDILFEDHGFVPQDVEVLDIDRDNLPEIVAVYAFSDTLVVFDYVDGAYTIIDEFPIGQFTGPANDSPRDIVVARFNNDPFVDIAVVCSGNPNIGTPGSVQLLVGNSFGELEPRYSLPEFEKHGEDPGPVKVGEQASFPLPDGKQIPVEGVRYDLVFPTVGAALNVRGNAGNPVLGVGHGQQPVIHLFLPTNALGLIPYFDIELPAEGGVRDITALPGGRDLLVLLEDSLWLVRGDLTEFWEPIRIDHRFNAPLTAMAIGDPDSNGEPEIFITGEGGEVYLYRNVSVVGDSTGANAVDAEREVIYRSNANDSTTGGGRVILSDLLFADFDGDGEPEVVAVDNSNNQVIVIPSDPERPPLRLPTSDAPRRGSIGDIDLDGRLDLIIANEGEANDSNTSNDDISVILNDSLSSNGPQTNQTNVGQVWDLYR